MVLDGYGMPLQIWSCTFGDVPCANSTLELSLLRGGGVGAIPCVCVHTYL